jgi:hypothetical protein
LLWPQDSVGHLIYIQQDNAKPQISPDEELFIAEAQAEGFDIQLRCQPPNSPDFNDLGLGFFNAIQALHHQAKDVETLIAATEKAFKDMEVQKLNKFFLALQQCMQCVFENEGGNRYKRPHI